MPLNPNVRFSIHIKVNGTPCSSPALRGEVFCYFHQRMIRGVRTPPKSRVHPMALIENEASIQVSVMEVINALVRNTIDFKRATLVLRALSIAVRNSSRVHLDCFKDEMVREVPEYPAAPAMPKPESAVALSQAGALARIKVAKPAGVAQPKAVLPKAVLPKAPATSSPVDPSRPMPPVSVKPSATRTRAFAKGRSG